MISKRCYVFGHVLYDGYELPALTPATAGVPLRSIRHSTNFHAVPAGSAVLVVRKDGG